MVPCSLPFQGLLVTAPAECSCHALMAAHLLLRVSDDLRPHRLIVKQALAIVADPCGTRSDVRVVEIPQA
jgi:hypothetical protein